MTDQVQDTTKPSIPPSSPKVAGFTRFEIELEFVSSLASPHYLSHLASTHYLSNPAFIAYLSYLQYWSHPPYLKYLMYPGPTLRHLELLQSEQFRRDVLSPGIVGALVEEGVRAGVEGPGRMGGSGREEGNGKMDTPAVVT